MDGLGGVTAIESKAGARPVPERLTVCGLLEALSENVRLPVRVPPAVGEKVTPTEQLARPDRLAPQVLELIAKSPLVAIPVKLRAVLCWLFARLTVIGLLVSPIGTFGKVRLVGDTVVGATPAPVRAAVCGLLVALSVTVSVPLAGPRAVGVNVTRMVQLAPLARREGLSGQVPPACAKLPVTAIVLMVRGAVATFLSVAVSAGLVVFWTCFPNASVVGERVTDVTAVNGAARTNAQRKVALRPSDV